jgi:type IV secretory pathway VirB3-like protein
MINITLWTNIFQVFVFWSSQDAKWIKLSFWGCNTLNEDLKRLKKRSTNTQQKSKTQDQKKPKQNSEEIHIWVVSLYIGGALVAHQSDAPTTSFCCRVDSPVWRPTELQRLQFQWLAASDRPVPRPDSLVCHREQQLFLQCLYWVGTYIYFTQAAIWRRGSSRNISSKSIHISKCYNTKVLNSITR